MLRPAVPIPHRTSVRNDLEAHYRRAQDQMFLDLPPGGKVSIAVDAWQSPFKKSFLAITAYYITADWKWREVLIGFEHLKGSHTGEAMAEIVLAVLERYKITNRLYCITSDNAAPNGKMRRALDDMLELLQWNSDQTWNHEATKIPCMAHVMQLVVKAMLAAFNVEPGEKDEEEEDDEEHSSRDPSVDLEEIGTVLAAIQKVGALEE
jgi:hypothetical protein